jgi:hypothetical protein
LAATSVFGGVAVCGAIVQPTRAITAAADARAERFEVLIACSCAGPTGQRCENRIDAADQA